MSNLMTRLQRSLNGSVLPEDPAAVARSSGHGDARRMLDLSKLRMAAVLLPFVECGGELKLWLTKRRHDLRGHPGQISFPGGGVEAGDEDLTATALRESSEEIGLAAAQVEVIGYLDPYFTITNYCVMPTVALVSPSFEPVPQPSEVADVFLVSAAAVLDPVRHECRRVRINGVTATYYVIQLDGRVIWGATAGMLVNLAEKLGEKRRV